jgi:hypothetical protein
LTLTHARIRAAQGDVRGARSILERLLREQPAHAEARALLRSLASLAERDHHEEAGLEPAAPVAADPRRLAAPFRRALGRERDAAGASRIRRLERWLERVAPQRDS